MDTEIHKKLGKVWNSLSRNTSGMNRGRREMQNRAPSSALHTPNLGVQKRKERRWKLRDVNSRLFLQLRAVNPFCPGPLPFSIDFSMDFRGCGSSPAFPICSCLGEAEQGQCQHSPDFLSPVLPKPSLRPKPSNSGKCLQSCLGSWESPGAEILILFRFSLGNSIGAVPMGCWREQQSWGAQSHPP